jgi:hypothetical protein
MRFLPISLIIDGKEFIYRTRRVGGVMQHEVLENGHTIITCITSQPFRAWAAENIEWEVRNGNGRSTVVSVTVDATP